MDQHFKKLSTQLLLILLKDINQHCIFSIEEKPLFIPTKNSYDLLKYTFFYLQKKTNRNQNLNIKTGGERQIQFSIQKIYNKRIKELNDHILQLQLATFRSLIFLPSARKQSLNVPVINSDQGQLQSFTLVVFSVIFNHFQPVEQGNQTLSESQGSCVCSSTRWPLGGDTVDLSNHEVRSTRQVIFNRIMEILSIIKV